MNFANVLSNLSGVVWNRSPEDPLQAGDTYVVRHSRADDYTIAAGDLWVNSIVAIAIKWLGDRFPLPRLVVSRVRTTDGTWIVQPPGDLESLWDRPNDFYGRRAMEKAIGLSLVADGNAYIKKVYDGTERLSELWWIPHTKIEPYSIGGDFITGYKINTSGMPETVARDRIIHIKDGIDPDNPRKGLSAVKAQLREICTVNEEGSYTYSILLNGGVAGLVLSPDSLESARLVKKEDAEEIKLNIRKATSGPKRGSPLVLRGPYKVSNAGFSPEQLALKELPRNALARIAAATGVANMAMGLPDPDKTYANYESALKTSWGTVESIQSIIAETLRESLMEDFRLDRNAYRISYDYTEVTEKQESRDSVHKRTRDDFLADLITKASAQDILGYDVDPDGDVYFSEIQQAMANAVKGPPPGVPSDFKPDGSPQDATANGRAKSWGY